MANETEGKPTPRRISVDIGPDKHLQLKVKAAHLDRSISECVIEALDHWLTTPRS